MLRFLALLVFLSFASPLRAGGKVTVAAAADLKFALEEIVTQFHKTHPGDQVETIYGSSGKFHAQIRQGAPYDLYFSADIAYPLALAAAGYAASEVKPYAVGRIVLWSPLLDARKLQVQDLVAPQFKRIAIANPKHAPYGKRAEEALRAAGVWEKVQDRLVFGENIAQTAQFVQTGNAQIGILALSLARHPELANKGGYGLIPEKLYHPLEQGFIITRRAAGNPLAASFSAYMGSPEARAVMVKYGFALPAESAGK
ncbi:MAG: molybdate ABC transporter substrate-binding protein [Pseudomonadota bacterium]|nr:molybdate ABC transporter substrate-binding protein [Pseudomonadota bacterium]